MTETRSAGCDLSAGVHASIQGCTIVHKLLMHSDLDKAPMMHDCADWPCRVFLFKWTVNWRMLPEQVFLHPSFAKGLLALQFVLLALFMHYSWLRKEGGILLATKRFVSTRVKVTSRLQRHVHAHDVITSVMISNLIGVVCARSLHYQFYSWYFHALPFLLWQTRLHVVVRAALLCVVEICWNVYPATAISSIALWLSHVVLLTMLWRERVYAMTA